MHGLSYLRTGSPRGPPPPSASVDELLSTSDGPVIAIGRRAATAGDVPVKADRLLVHLIDTRGLSGVSDGQPKPATLQLNLSNALAGHAGDCPTSLRLLTPESATTSIQQSSCAEGGNTTRFSVASPLPWSVIVAEWALS